MGTVQNVIKSLKIFVRANDQEVTNTTFDGHIVKTDGSLTITPISVTLSSQSATEVYSGDTLTRPALTITGAFLPSEVDAPAEVTGKIVDYGSVPNTIDYHPNSSFDINNYNLVINEGILWTPSPSRTWPS